MLKLIVHSFLLFVFAAFTWAAPLKIPILLCPYDTGDSTIIKRVSEGLDQRKIDYRILCHGRAGQIFKDHTKCVLLEGGDVQDRARPLSDQELAALREKFEPKSVLAGMASKGQAQILNTFQKRAAVFAIYDNFDPPSGKAFIQPFMDTIKAPTALMVPGGFLVEGFQSEGKGRFSQILVVGQPALSEWKDVFERLDRDALREKLGLDAAQKVILFAGGMDETYKDYFKVFVQAVKTLPDSRVFVTYHPKSTGDVERQIVAEEGASNILVSNDVKTNELAALADVLVCHQSSVCQQAFSVGVRCAYVAGPEYNNFLIEGRLVPRFAVVDALRTFLKDATGKPTQETLEQQRNLMKKAGIPQNPVDLILTHLLA